MRAVEARAALAGACLALLLGGCGGLYERFADPPHRLVAERYPGKKSFLVEVRAELSEDPHDHAPAPAPPAPSEVEKLVCDALEGTAFRCRRADRGDARADLQLLLRYDSVQPRERRRGPILFFRRLPGDGDEPLDYGASFQWSFSLRDARTGEEIFAQTAARMSYEVWDAQVGYWVHRLFGGRGYRREPLGGY